jgi:hypothetical protein
VHIDRLALHGFDYRDHKKISVAIGNEVANLIKAEIKSNTAAYRNTYSRLGRLSVKSSSTNPQFVGKQVSRSIHRALENSKF